MDCRDHRYVIAITTDNLDPWMGFEPFLHAFRLSIWQQVNGHPLFQIDKDCSIGMPAMEGKIIAVMRA